MVNICFSIFIIKGTDFLPKRDWNRAHQFVLSCTRLTSEILTKNLFCFPCPACY